MKRFLPAIALLIVAALIFGSCHKPPISTGHKSYKHSRKNR